MIDSLAAVSLVIALALSAVWISHILSPGLWLKFGFRAIHTSRHEVYLGDSTNMIGIEWIEYFAKPIVGPATSDKSAAAAFQRGFSHPQFDLSLVRLKTMIMPCFGTTRSGNVAMLGTISVYLVPFGLLILVFSILPGLRWLPALFRWTRLRFSNRAGC